MGSQLEHLIDAENGQPAANDATRIGDDQPPIRTLPFLVVAKLFAPQSVSAKRFDLLRKPDARPSISP
jgi:hypothetical protein